MESQIHASYGKTYIKPRHNDDEDIRAVQNKNLSSGATSYQPVTITFWRQHSKFTPNFHFLTYFAACLTSKVITQVDKQQFAFFIHNLRLSMDRHLIRHHDMIDNVNLEMIGWASISYQELKNLVEFVIFFLFSLPGGFFSYQGL